MGRRLRLAREKLLLSQAELGRLLELGQNTISDIERGHLRTVDVSLARLDAVLAGHLDFVLTGKNAEKYKGGVIGTEYWKVRLRRKPVDEEFERLSDKNRPKRRLNN